jgi:hypothetical protein
MDKKGKAYERLDKNFDTQHKLFLERLKRSEEEFSENFKNLSIYFDEKISKLDNIINSSASFNIKKGADLRNMTFCE